MDDLANLDVVRMRDCVPQLSLSEGLQFLYDFSELDEQTVRYEKLISEYKRVYGRAPEFIARAPGRVNLIGEHIDYEGYSVLPMAISLDTLVAVGTRDEASLHVSNVDHEGHAAGTLPIDPREPVDVDSHSWRNYVHAAYKGVFLHYWRRQQKQQEKQQQQKEQAAGAGAGEEPPAKKAKADDEASAPAAAAAATEPNANPGAGDPAPNASMEVDGGAAAPAVSPAAAPANGDNDDDVAPNENCDDPVLNVACTPEEVEWPSQKGINMVVDGRVPQGSGLSSSSALVCAVSLAVMHAKGMSFTKEEIAEFARECEKYVGTMSGGMDQAISIMGERGFAKLIDFNPVKAFSVPLPIGGTFVIANTIVQSLKAVGGEGKYNLRVLECTLASIVLGLSLGLPKELALELKTLKEVQELMGEKKESPVEVLQEKLHTEEYSKQELEGILGMPLEGFFEDQPEFLRAVAFCDRTGQGYGLYNRALHVYSEADRVSTMCKLCSDESKDKFERIGRVMTASHRSCKTLYNCSSPELDELVQLAISNGAYGARLTGAGWGGCVVAYVSENIKNKFVEEIYRAYYKKKLDEKLIEREQLKNCIFPSKPTAGACIVLFPAEPRLVSK